MSWVFSFKPEFKAPYRSDDVEESCVRAYNYFSTLVDDFVQMLPEHRLPLESDDDEPTLADRVHLIFPNGFGEFDEEKNHNPRLWPVLIGLSEALYEGASQDFADQICEAWKETFNADGQCNEQAQLLQRIFDYITCYLQLFVVLTDGDSVDLDFKYPPDLGGVLLGTRYRRPEYSEVTSGFATS